MAASGTPRLIASRFMSWPLATELGSWDAPAKMMIGAYWRRQRSTAVSVRGPVSPESATIASRGPDRILYVEQVPEGDEEGTGDADAGEEAREETAHRAPRSLGGELRLRRTATGFEAGTAVHRPVGARREGHLARLAAIAADDVVHVLRSLRRPLGLCPLPALGTTLWLVQEPFLLIELLLARGPRECGPACAAAEGLVRESHSRRSRQKVLRQARGATGLR